MATLRGRVLELVTSEPGLTDREVADRLVGPAAPQQGVNQVARQLASAGQLMRRQRPDGRIGNYPGSGHQKAVASPPTTIETQSADFLSEDDAKRKLQAWLEAASWKVDVIYGHGHGIDIEARRGEDRWVIEVKGEGSLNAMRVNYFLGILGELLQRMNDPKARYSIALPDHRQFRGLWERLPALAKQRTGISALFVDRSGQVREEGQ